jgi:hypothetical protein
MMIDAVVRVVNVLLTSGKHMNPSLITHFSQKTGKRTNNEHYTANKR